VCCFHYFGYMPFSVVVLMCESKVALYCRGIRLHVAGFLVQEESIGKPEQNDPTKKNVLSQSIKVYANEIDKESKKGDNKLKINIGNGAIWRLLESWIPTITQIVKDNRDRKAFAEFYPNELDKEPVLDGIFFRKDSPDAERSPLTIHRDTNMNTVNVVLNDDYEGGGLFYTKPLANTGKINPSYIGYEWVDSVKRENTSDIIFPSLQVGDAIVYNYTVDHATAPVESGSRYSMAFFFDMDNPALRNDPGKERLEVQLQSMLHGLELDIVLVYDALHEKHVSKVLFDKITPDVTVTCEAYEGDTLHALVAGTDKLVSEIEIGPYQSYYKISDEPEDPDEFRVKLHNDLPDIELDIVLIYDAAEERDVWKAKFDNVFFDEDVFYFAYEGDVLRALVAGTETVVSDIEIRLDQSLYAISQIELESSEL